MTSLPERLRNETRSLHEQTEQLFYTEALQNGTLTVAQYKHLLQTHLGFHQALEAAIDQHPQFFQTYEPDTRRKAAWLRDDLASLQEPILQSDTTLLSHWSPVTLLGAAYVGEGSMLGGTVIGRLLQKNNAIQPLLAHARFYQGYGSSTGSQWKKFLAFLTEKGDAHADDVVMAARQAFSDYQALFRRVGRFMAEPAEKP